MTTLRHRFHVVVDGSEYEVRTSARDMANAEVDHDGPTSGGVWTTFRLVHAAMLRLDLPIPTDLDAFVDVLDEVEALDGAESAEPDPTRAAV
jgi:hypothetical protein